MAASSIAFAQLNLGEGSPSTLPALMGILDTPPHTPRCLVTQEPSTPPPPCCFDEDFQLLCAEARDYDDAHLFGPPALQAPLQTLLAQPLTFNDIAAHFDDTNYPRNVANTQNAPVPAAALPAQAQQAPSSSSSSASAPAATSQATAHQAADEGSSVTTRRHFSEDDPLQSRDDDEETQEQILAGAPRPDDGKVSAEEETLMAAGPCDGKVWDEEETQAATPQPRVGEALEEDAATAPLRSTASSRM